MDLLEIAVLGIVAMVAVNVRCLPGVDLDALEVKKYDGASA